MISFKKLHTWEAPIGSQAKFQVDLLKGENSIGIVLIGCASALPSWGVGGAELATAAGVGPATAWQGTQLNIFCFAFTCVGQKKRRKRLRYVRKCCCYVSGASVSQALPTKNYNLKCDYFANYLPFLATDCFWHLIKHLIRSEEIVARWKMHNV